MSQPLDPEWSALLGVGSSIVSAFIGYGIMREKVMRLESDFRDFKQDAKAFVTHEHFNAVLEPLKRTLEMVQRDVKEILRAVSTSSISEKD